MTTDHAAAIRPLCDLFRSTRDAFLMEAKLDEAEATRIRAEVDYLLALWQSGQLDQSLCGGESAASGTPEASAADPTIPLH